MFNEHFHCRELWFAYCNPCELIFWSLKFEIGIKKHVRNLAIIIYEIVELVVILFTFHTGCDYVVPQNLVYFVKKCFHWQKVKVGCIFHHKFDFKKIFWICAEDKIGFAFLLKLLNIGFENFSILRGLCLKLEKILDVYSSRYWPIQVKTCKILFKNQIIEIENCEILLIRPEVVLGCTNRQSFLF